MFEHMISVRKSYYRPNTINKRFCKILLFFAFITLLVVFIVDLSHPDSKGFIIVYIPLLLSLALGGKVWRDMRPKYQIEWQMRDGTKDRIAGEQLMKEWLQDSPDREAFMEDLLQAINEALSAKTWWPANTQIQSANLPELMQQRNENAEAIAATSNQDKAKSPLVLVNSQYESIG